MVHSQIHANDCVPRACVGRIWDVTKHFRVAGELTYRKTAYSFLGNNDGVGFHTQVVWKF